LFTFLNVIFNRVTTETGTGACGSEVYCLLSRAIISFCPCMSRSKIEHR